MVYAENEKIMLKWNNNNNNIFPFVVLFIIIY